MSPDKFPEVLKRIRAGKNLSQEKLGELSGLDRTYISLLERGLRQPTLQTLFKISNAMSILPSEIIKSLEAE
jgi:transcriptional regulator with XRE-family HTH domain